MTRRIDQKEDRIGELCDQYGLDFEYAWGKYYIGARSDWDSTSVIIFSRQDLSEWDEDRIEEIVLEYVLLAGF